MIIATFRFKVPNARRKDFLDSARLVSGPTEVQPGCISCRFYQDLGNPDSIFFVEEWKSHEDLERRIKSDDYRIILEMMELSEEQPEININTISNSEGFEAIEALRS